MYVRKAHVHSLVFPAAVISRCCQLCSCWSSQPASTTSSRGLFHSGTELADFFFFIRDAPYLNWNMVPGPVNNNNIFIRYLPVNEAWELDMKMLTLLLDQSFNLTYFRNMIYLCNDFLCYLFMCVFVWHDFILLKSSTTLRQTHLYYHHYYYYYDFEEHYTS